jgi:hypothetical protein
MSKTRKIEVERVQTGLRIESKILKVLKGMAEYKDLGTNEMLELILMHAFENRPAFSDEGFRAVRDLKKVYGMGYDVHAYKDFIENSKK